MIHKKIIISKFKMNKYLKYKGNITQLGVKMKLIDVFKWIKILVNKVFKYFNKFNKKIKFNSK